MKIHTSHFKGQFLFLLGLTIPAVLISNINPAQAEPTSSTQIRQNGPFIDSNSRYDSLGRLQIKPIGDINQQDGGSGKESSDDKKKESKDGKEQCESGNCGGIILNRGEEVINPAILKPIQINPIQTQGGKLNSKLPKQLLNSQQPII
jgi:hypothetical protein